MDTPSRHTDNGPASNAPTNDASAPGSSARAETTGDGWRTYKAFALRVLTVILIGTLAGAIWLIHDTLLIVFTSILAAIILRALARRIAHHLHIGLKWGLALATAAAFSFIGSLIFFFGQEFTLQIGELGGRLPEAWNDLRDIIVQSGYEAEFTEQINRSIPDGSTILSLVQVVVSSISGIVTGLVLALMGGIYLASQPEVYLRGATLLVPKAAARRTEQALLRTNQALKGWLKGQVISMLFTGVCITVGLIVIDVPSPLALGFVAGLLGFVPMIGPLIAAAFGLLLALTVNFHTVLLTAALYLVVQQIAGNIIEPLLWQHTVKIPPALTLFGLLITGTLFGPVGVLLGGPLLVGGFILTRELYVKGALDYALDDDMPADTATDKT